MIVHTFLANSTFIRKDQKILESGFPVNSFEFIVKHKWHLPFILIKQFVFLILNFGKTKIYISQFAGYHSFLPCLFARLSGKRSIIISGGTDCVSFPGIRYGNFYRPFLKWFTTQSYRLCSVISPKHESLWYCDYTFDKSEPPRQGISAFVPGLKNKYKPITNGYDTEFWTISNFKRKPRSFITVSGGFDYPFQVQLKGIDLILEIASNFPECEFTIVGVPEWKKLNLRSGNVRIIPATPNDKLPEIYNSHEYYLQLSMAEGFPNALCEAMLCGCTPIVSSVFSMPEIVGKNGYVLYKRDKEELKNLIEKAIELGPNPPHETRELIATRFTLENRKKKLMELVNSMI